MKFTYKFLKIIDSQMACIGKPENSEEFIKQKRVRRTPRVQREQRKVAILKAEGFIGHVSELKLALAMADAELAVQQSIATDLHAYLRSRGPTIENATK